MSQISHRQRVKQGVSVKPPGFRPQLANVIHPNTPPVPAPVPAPQLPESNMVVPTSNRSALTPQQLAQHGKRLAETFAQLDQDHYTIALAELESKSPTLYAIVVDELHNLAAENTEDDGYDLSDIAQG